MKEIRDNAFRILALPADAAEGEMLRQKARLDVMVRFGREIAMAWNFPVKGGTERDDGNVQAAMDHLTLPENRLNEAIFWFVNDASPESLAHLQQGEWASAAALWRAALQDISADATHFAVWHNYSSLQLLQAFESDTPDADLLAEGVHCKLQCLLGSGFAALAERVHGPDSPDAHAAIRYFVDTLILRLAERHWSASQIEALFETAPEPWVEYVQSQLPETPEPVTPPPAEEVPVAEMPPKAESPEVEVPADMPPELPREETPVIPEPELKMEPEPEMLPVREVKIERVEEVQAYDPGSDALAMEIEAAFTALHAHPGEPERVVAELKRFIPQLKKHSGDSGAGGLSTREIGDHLANELLTYCEEAVEAAEIRYEKESTRNRPKAAKAFLPVIKQAGTAMQGIGQLQMNKSTRIRLGKMRKHLVTLSKEHGRFTPSPKLSLAPAAFILALMGVIVWRVWWYLG